MYLSVPLIQCFCLRYLNFIYFVCAFQMAYISFDVSKLPLLVHSCLNDVENSIMNPHSCSTLVRVFALTALSLTIRKCKWNSTFATCSYIFHFRPIKNANSNRSVLWDFSTFSLEKKFLSHAFCFQPKIQFSMPHENAIESFELYDCSSWKFKWILNNLQRFLIILLIQFVF